MWERVNQLIEFFITLVANYTLSSCKETKSAVLIDAATTNGRNGFSDVSIMESERKQTPKLDFESVS